MSPGRCSACVIEQTSWGHLEWYASGQIGNSDAVTVGLCVIDPGRANGRHKHPNCTETLTVMQGHIVHTWDDEEYEMGVGDVISIPTGVSHNARNIGQEVSKLFIVFDNPYRETVGVEE